MMDFKKRAGWIRVWWLITIPATCWAIFIGQHQSFEGKKFRNYEFHTEVAEDIENQECKWLLLPAQYLYDPAYAKMEADLIARDSENMLSGKKSSTPCINLFIFKKMTESMINNTDLKLPMDFFVKDFATYRIFMSSISQYGKRTFEHYIIMVYVLPVVVFIGSWVLFLILLMLVKWIARGFR